MCCFCVLYIACCLGVLLVPPVGFMLYVAFVAGVGWRNCSQWEQDNDVTKILANAWMIFQPILFVLIGTEIQVND